MMHQEYYEKIQLLGLWCFESDIFYSTHKLFIFLLLKCLVKKKIADSLLRQNAAI